MPRTMVTFTDEREITMTRELVYYILKAFKKHSISFDLKMERRLIEWNLDYENDDGFDTMLRSLPNDKLEILLLDHA